MQNIKKNQHYISQFILSYFSNEDKKVYECTLRNKSISHKSIKTAMSDEYTYEHEFFEINEIENQFSKIESWFGRALKEIITSLEIGTSIDVVRNKLNNNLRNIFIFYYRSGALLYEFSFGLKSKEESVLHMLERLSNSTYLKGLKETIIKYYNFAVICSDQGDFLISDQYISTAALSIKNKFAQISNRHIGLKDTLILVPVSKNYYAVYYHGDVPNYIFPNRINQLTDIQVCEINNIIINNSYRKCISNKEEPLSIAIENFEEHSPMGMIAGFEEEGPILGATLKKEVFLYHRDRKAWDLLETPPFEYDIYNNVGRNDLCPCGSNIKYKKCCLEAVQIAKRIITTFAIQQTFPFAQVNKLEDTITPNVVIEMPVTSFYRDINKD